MVHIVPGAGFLSGLWESIYKTLISTEGWKVILQGLGTTLLIALFAVVIGTVLGCLLALCKISGIGILKGIANVYTTVIRGIPVVTQLMIFAFVILG